MKKLLFTILAILTCGVSYTLPIGNPAEPSLLSEGFFCEGSGNADIYDFWCDPCVSWCDVFSFRFGFYGDYVFNRHMERQDFGGGDIDNMQIYTNAGYIALNLFNQIDIFTTLGASNFSTNSSNVPTVNIQSEGSRLRVESETKFSWSVGGRVSLLECGCWVFGVEGQYFAFNPDIERVAWAAQALVYPDDTLDVKYSEWQVGGGLAYKTELFVPYIGLKWARSKLDTNNVLITPQNTVFYTIMNDLESKKLWGYAVGVSLVGCERASLTAEGRFGDEKGVYVNGQFRF